MGQGRHRFEEEEVVLHLSDLHIGEVVDLPDNHYNIEIAKRRLVYFFEKALRIARDIYGRVMPIHKAHIFITGDLVHNETMRGSAKMSAQVDFTEQVRIAAEVLAEEITNFVTRFTSLEEVHVYGARGNHGRIGKPGDESPNANLDRQVFYILGMLLKGRFNTGRLKRRGVRLTTSFPAGPYVHARVAGWYWVAEHFSGVKNQLGIPYYGLARRRDLLFKQNKGRMDVLLGGHFHRGYYEDDGTVEVIMNPSLVGLNDFALELGSGNIAKQNLYMVSRKWGITTKRPIKLLHIQEA